VAVRTGTGRGRSKHALAGLAVVGIVGITTVVAGWGVSPVEPREISPADVVALRFPADWSDETTEAAPAESAESTAAAETPAAPAAFALASAESRPIEANILFSPQPTNRLPAGTLAFAPAQDPVDAQANARLLEPRATMPMEIGPAARVETRIESRPDSRPDTRIAVAPATRSLAPAPERHVAPRVRKDSGALFNDAQLASIKNRLKLTGDQQQYWPAVESALRDIGLRAARDLAHAGNTHGGASHAAAIDPDSTEVQRLKSAAFPLIMSMNDDQKREVRTLAQVMGLDRVAASF
jgi:hypothetical protein